MSISFILALAMLASVLVCVLIGLCAMNRWHQREIAEMEHTPEIRKALDWANAQKV